jgi:hypothetical protein
MTIRQCVAFTPQAGGAGNEAGKAQLHAGYQAIATAVATESCRCRVNLQLPCVK